MVDRLRRAPATLTVVVMAACMAGCVMAGCVNLDALSAAEGPDGSSGGDAAAPVDASPVDGTVPPDDYDRVVLGDRPVAFWDMASATATEPDLTGGGHAGTYAGGQPTRGALPNGQAVADFDGTKQYMRVETSAAFSIATTGRLTWEAWIRPDTLSFPDTIDGDYVHWLGKCASYAPSCEWQARFGVGGKALSALAFNVGGGSGSGADWQPTLNLLRAGQWLHVVGEYQTATTPTDCVGPPPGSIGIWVNGVLWNASSHRPRGCMSESSITPAVADSPLIVGSVALDSFFAGSIGKVAIYDTLLTQERISAHFKTMTGVAPSGSCDSTCTIPVPTPTSR